MSSISRAFSLLSCFVLLLLATQSVRADPVVIGSGELHASEGWASVFSQVRLVIEFQSSSGQPVATAFDLIVSPTDVGRIFILNSGTQFDAAARFLTDGANGTIIFFSGPGMAGGGLGGIPFTESELFFGDPNGPRGIDFEGFAISSLEFRLDEFSLDSPGRNPNGDGLWTDYTVRGTLRVNGTQATPEPSTLLLLGTGLAGIAAGVRRRRRLFEKLTQT